MSERASERASKEAKEIVTWLIGTEPASGLMETEGVYRTLKDKIASKLEEAYREIDRLKQVELNYQSWEPLAKKVHEDLHSRIDIAREALEWAKEEIDNSGEVRYYNDDTWSHEHCEYLDDPEKGKCSFCYGYVALERALEKLKEGS